MLLLPLVVQTNSPMATFLTRLFESIFTPGPTPTLVFATNASFAALQVLFLALFVATSSVHFAVLSFLSAGLWWAINWFVKELQAAETDKDNPKGSAETKREADKRTVDESGSETDRDERADPRTAQSKGHESGLRVTDPEGAIRKRRSFGEASGGDMSTDSEWDKVEDEGEGDK